jgi:hypothetical protein
MHFQCRRMSPSTYCHCVQQCSVQQCCRVQAVIVHLHAETGSGSDPVSTGSHQKATRVTLWSPALPGFPVRPQFLLESSKPAGRGPAPRAARLSGSLLLCLPRASVLLSAGDTLTVPQLRSPPAPGVLETTPHPAGPTRRGATIVYNCDCTTVD